VPSARVIDLAEVLISNRPIETIITGIRPGEKVHEVLVSAEEAHRTIARGNFYAIKPMLPEIRSNSSDASPLEKEYSSADSTMTRAELATLLDKHNLLVEAKPAFQEELLA
jgi:UDP-glucose 4-epimerase